MFWLGLVGLAAGTLLQMFGQAEENKRQRELDLLQAQQLREQVGIYGSQARNIQAQIGEVGKDVLAAGQIQDIGQRALSIKGYETAYAGAAAKGQIGARAGAGNLAGASILRQALSVQRATERQMSLITGEKQKMAIEYSDTLREFDIKKMQLGTSLLTAELGGKWAGEEAKLKEDEAEWLRKYGWMSVAGIGLQGFGQGVSAGVSAGKW